MLIAIWKIHVATWKKKVVETITKFGSTILSLLLPKLGQITRHTKQPHATLGKAAWGRIAKNIKFLT